MKVAITGASGAIGSYVIRDLQQCGHDVVAVSRSPTATTGIRHVSAGIDDADTLAAAFDGAEAVVHLAAITSPFRASAANVIAVNVMGTVNVLEAAVAAGARRVVLASSGAATGFSFQLRERRPGYLPLDEQHPCEPDDSYGLSKLLAEMACARWSRAHPLSTICLRINSNWYVDRAGAEAALRGGWGKGLAVEDMWKRYRMQLEQPERPRSSDAPPLPRDLLWAVTDARDAAQAFRLAVENETIQHEVFLINGADTCSRQATESLVGEHYPAVEVRAPLSGHCTLISHQKASARLGYWPRYSWRHSDFADWLQSGASGPDA
ncbi:MAG: NAD(P)-dependent oxidoreductase [Solirubrobacterales bacterium]|nr:NAD(P)-dependent oxidoreductase [Solirubrobacterales bacterium]